MVDTVIYNSWSDAVSLTHLFSVIVVGRANRINESIDYKFVQNNTSHPQEPNCVRWVGVIIKIRYFIAHPDDGFLQPARNPFGGEIMHIYQVKASGMLLHDATQCNHLFEYTEAPHHHPPPQ